MERNSASVCYVHWMQCGSAAKATNRTVQGKRVTVRPEIFIPTGESFVYPVYNTGREIRKNSLNIGCSHTGVLEFFNCVVHECKKLFVILISLVFYFFILICVAELWIMDRYERDSKHCCFVIWCLWVQISIMTYCGFLQSLQVNAVPSVRPRPVSSISLFMWSHGIALRQDTNNILGSHGFEYEDGSLLVCWAVPSLRSL